MRRESICYAEIFCLRKKRKKTEINEIEEVMMFQFVREEGNYKV